MSGMVIFQIMSDLHLETHPQYELDFPQTAPHLALLGDIGLVRRDDLFQFLEQQLHRFKVVFFLLGNHEPYQLKIPFAKERVQAFTVKMEKLRTAKYPALGEFVFLDQTRYDLDDHVTVLGCTLHSRVLPEQANTVASRMADFRQILDWDVGDHVDAHMSDLAWLNEQVADVARIEPKRKIVIFTHHSPSLDDRATEPKHRTSEVSSGFVTDLKDEGCWNNEDVVLWAFGHTHFNCDFYDEHGKRVVANQKGYIMFPNSSFCPSRIFEVGEKPVSYLSQKLRSLFFLRKH